MTSSNDNAMHDRDDGATWWARKSLGTLTAREAAEFDAWEQDEANDADLCAIEAMMGQFDELAALPEVRDMREAALAVQPDRARPTWQWIVAGIAACFVALIPVGGMIANWMTSAGGPDMIAPSFYSTRFAEQRDVRLEDGSIVTLNPSTKIAVALSAETRRIRVMSGQALFKVAKSRNWPFIVEAGNEQITATGTAFDVRVKPNGAMSVLLVEGRVNVAPVAHSFIGEFFQSMRTKALVPGQRLSSDDDGNRLVENASAELADYADRERILFNDTTIGDVIAQINRRSTVHIEVSDPHIAALRLSGVYNVDRGDDFLTALTTFYPLTVRPHPNGSISIDWRDEGKDPHSRLRAMSFGARSR